MPLESCPGLQEWQDFHNGNLPLEMLDTLAGHLENCPNCEAILRDIENTGNPVLGGLRGVQTFWLGEKPTPEPSSGVHATLPATAPESVQDWPPPGFEILEKLGQGGMGMVYKARDLRLNRLVAMKYLRPGNPKELARFRREAQAVASLHHPNIIQIYEIGVHQGQPFLALEFMDGGTLKDRLEGGTPAPATAAAMMEVLARAVHHAHGQGIIHRDLKPANVLLVRKTSPSSPNNPDDIDNFEPKLGDFGIAKQLVEESGQTMEGTILGTPAYMAPEQARGEITLIGRATDVYSLGAIFYEMLTGRTALEGASAAETLALVRNQDPVPPRRLRPSVPRDLETICLKCLRKEPRRRFASALELAEDLARFRAGQPIKARRIGLPERALKWAKRRPALAASLAATLLLLLAGFILVTWAWSQARRQADIEADGKRKIAKEKRQVDQLTAHLWLDQGIHRCESGDAGLGMLSLARAVDLAHQLDEKDLETAARLNLAAWQPHFFPLRFELPHNQWVRDLVFSPDGKTILTASRDNTIGRWDAAGQSRGKPLELSGEVVSLAYRPDGKIFVSGSKGADGQGEIQVWDAVSFQPLGKPLAQPYPVLSVAFASDGRTFMSHCIGQVQMWDAATRKPAGPPMHHPDKKPIFKAVLSPDGKSIAGGGADGSILLWDAGTGRLTAPLRGHSGKVEALAFSNDGTLLVSGDNQGTVRLWCLPGGQAGPVLKHSGPIKALALSRDGKWLATAGFRWEMDFQTKKVAAGRGQVVVWETSTGRKWLQPLLHPAPVWSLAFSPNHQALLTGCEDGEARLFHAVSGQQLGMFLHQPGTVARLGFNADGSTAWTASWGGGHFGAALWQMPADFGNLRPLISDVIRGGLVLSPEGKTLLVGEQFSDKLHQWDLEAGQVVRTLPDAGLPLAFTRDGRAFLTRTGDGWCELWNIDTGKMRGRWKCGKVWAAAADAQGIRVFETDGDKGRIREIPGGQTIPLASATGPLQSAVFIDHGRTLITSSKDGSLQCWDNRGTRIHSHRFPAGRRLFGSPTDDSLYLGPVQGRVYQRWNFQSGRFVGRPIFGPEILGNLAIAGQFGFVADQSGVRLWHLASGRPIGSRFHLGSWGSNAISTDATVAVFTAEKTTTMFLWKLPSPVSGTPERLRLWVEILTGQELNEQGTVKELDSKTRRERRQILDKLGGPPI